MALSLLIIGDKAMNFLHIPGFGTFNKPLPEALGIFVADAVATLKNNVFPAKVDPVQVAQIEEPIVEVQQEDSDIDPNAELAINLASSHSVVLEQTLQKEEAPQDVRKVEEKKEESVFSVPTEASKPRKRSRHSHSHHSHRTSKK